MTRAHITAAAVESTVLNTSNDLKRRKQNLIITGLPETDGDGDTDHDEQLFLKLCEDHLPVKPLPVRHSARRLGMKTDDRPRRLLIKLQSEDSVKAVISAAKSLHHSDDEYVRQSVYINADLSPAEAKLAYKKRKRRREQIVRRQAET